MRKKKTGLTNAAHLSPQLTANSIIGKQSVRTTFRLPLQIIELLSVAASQLGLKQKSLFDLLLEDSQNLHRIAEEEKEKHPFNEERHQKTYVISRSSLSSLSQIAKEHQVPRDTLVEMSIKRLFPLISDEHEKQEKRKIILNEAKSYLGQGQKLLQKSSSLLGKEDQVSIRLTELVNLCKKSVMELDEVVEKGKRMDTFFKK